MQPERLHLVKVFDAPFLSLDGTSTEMASLLFLFLSVIAVGALGKHRQKLRRAVQAVSLLVFFYVIYSCLGVFGMIRNGLHGLSLLGTAYTESFYWMALPVVVIGATVITGPQFCGWICPTGTLQDVVGSLRAALLRRGMFRLTRTRLAALGATVLLFIAAVAWLGLRKQMFIEDSSLHWSAALLLLSYMVLAGFIDDLPTRLLRKLSFVIILATSALGLTITSPVHFAFTSRNDPASALATAVIMAAPLFVPRAFCRYLCPWGYLMGLLHPLSRLRVARLPARCDGCQACGRACDVGAIDRAGKVRLEHCQLCHACVDHCPAGALHVVDIWHKRRQERS